MKSYKQWSHQQRYLEFVGPAGQVDPQGIEPHPAMANPSQMQDPSQMSNVGPIMQHLIKALSTKPANQIMQAQQMLNQQFHTLLQGKSQSIARNSLNQGINSFRMAKQQMGQPQQAQISA